MLKREDIIGQNELINRIDNLIENNNFPRFSIIVGPKNSGKKLIANYIANKLDATFIPCEVKADSVRNVINESYTQTNLMCYMWADSDTMSITSKNAILKVTEEPPQKAYFIITLNDINNMIPTIISRGTKFLMNAYSENELIKYATNRQYDFSKHKDIIFNICSNPGDVDNLFSYNVDNFVAFTEKVISCIGIASPQNALKLSNNFILKKDEKSETDKYDIILFIHAVSSICLSKLKETNNAIYGDACKLCADCVSEFRVSSISKLAVLDKWLLNMRELFSSKEVN